ncbi:MAG TPA: RNA polymerase sigma factor [Gammaproteobacteria bacterium]|nr:RNA polymerase sigma factor [Gammaproteobacteria bacterium]
MNKYSSSSRDRLRAEMLDGLPRLRRFARGLTGNAADADDLMQATAEKVLTAGVPDHVDVLRWMFKVCKNLFIDQLRSREVRRRAAERPELVPETSVSGEDVALGELSLREVDRAMAALSEDQRAVIMLVAVEGLTYREAAEALDVRIGTVMSRLARARAALAKRLGGNAGEEEPDRD